MEINNDIQKSKEDEQTEIEPVKEEKEKRKEDEEIIDEEVVGINDDIQTSKRNK